MTYRLATVFDLPLVREPQNIRFLSARAVYEFCQDLEPAAQETFQVLTLSQKHTLIDRHLVSLGSLTASLVHPREVFRRAIHDSAAAVILIHNHPSGDPTPSREDRDITRRLKEAGDLLGIPVLDHVIVGRGRYASLAEEGLL